MVKSKSHAKLTCISHQPSDEVATLFESEDLLIGLLNLANIHSHTLKSLIVYKKTLVQTFLIDRDNTPRINMKLLIATRNNHKFHEIKHLFKIQGLSLLSIADFPSLPEVIEDGDTFEKNAIKKATTQAHASGYWSLADDSGLEVDALGGSPGVYSARYAGETADDDANNRKLLEELQKNTRRTARYRCVLALASPKDEVHTVDGTCEGSIAYTCKGTNGFGYDALFIPTGYHNTFGELETQIKDSISHRAKALKIGALQWNHLLSSSA